MTVDPRPSYEQTLQREYRGVSLKDCEVSPTSTVFVLTNRHVVLWSDPVACCYVCHGPFRIAPCMTIWDDWVVQELVKHYLRDHPETLAN